MNCLQCGKQLALLKKLREDAFCSAEHREEFFETHQKFALERLLASGARLRARREAILNPPAEPEPPSAGFLPQITEFTIRNWVAPFSNVVEAGDFDLLMLPPEWNFQPATKALLCSLLELPAPYPAAPSASSLSSLAPEPIFAEGSIALIGFPAFRLDPAKLGLGSSSLPLRRPRSVDVGPNPTFSSQHQDFPTATEKPRLESSASNTLLGSAARMLRLRRPELRTESPQMQEIISGAASVALPVEIAPLPQRGCSAEPISPPQLDRLFKARPRAAVADASLRTFEQIPPASGFSPSAPMMVARPLLASAATPVVTNTVSGRPARPVDGRGQTTSNSPLASVPVASSPPRVRTNAAQAESSSLSIPLADRFFRTRPRGPVQGLSVPGWEPIEPGLPSLPIRGAVFGALSTVADRELEPVWLDRVYRMRPRGPVPDRTPAAESETLFAIQVAPADFLAPRAAVPAMPEALRDTTHLAMAAVASSRPAATGAGSIAFRPSELKTSEAGLQPSRTLVAKGDRCATLELPIVDKFFRPRPRAGVSDAALASYHQLPTGPVLEMSLGNHAMPTVAFGSQSLDVPIVDKLFRPRPRAGVSDAALASYHQLPTGPVLDMSAGNHAIPTVPLESHDSAPAESDRVFRHRPRGGVPDYSLILVQSIASSEAVNPSVPRVSMPSITVALASSEPAFLDRLFRPRPRAGINDPRLSEMERIPTGAAEPVKVEMVVPTMPAVLMRQTRPAAGRPIRMKPRNSAVVDSNEEEQSSVERRAARQVS